MTKEEAQKLRLKKIKENPVIWAKAFLKTIDNETKELGPWTARWYQAEILMSPERRRVCRMGRRTGKCLPGWVKVYDPIKNQYITIEELYKKKSANVLAYDREGEVLVSMHTAQVFDNGVKEVFHLVTEDGKEIDATGNHPFLDEYGDWIELQHLKVGNHVAVVKYLQDEDNLYINYSKIVKIESIGFHQTYDLTVPIYHNFIAQDFIVHNTESICIEALYKTNTRKSFRFLFIAPYENQVSLFFERLNELIDLSPLVKDRVISRTKKPYLIKFDNQSSIRGFTTGAASGGGGASIRGQRADEIAIDESDYMADADFDAVLMIAGERSNIPIILSSTPTGARKKFWQCCTDPALGFTEFYYPSMVNPNWGPSMEEEFRATLSPSGYVHEVNAEFGSEDSGVFNKDKVDAATQRSLYCYDELTYSQQMRVQENKWQVESYLPPPGQYGIYRSNPFRTMGVDFDKFQASSSILILDYDMSIQKFRVIRRIEVPKAEYSLDLAVNMIIDLNAQYDPAFIYMDRGYGDLQLEQLHKYGDENPESGLKVKVKGWQFANKIDVFDPFKHVVEKKPLKPFMVSQLQIMFERDQIVLSPFDELLYKQLIDYSVIRISAKGEPVFSSKNEHFVDALGLASLAFTLEFPNLTKIIDKPDLENPLISTIEGNISNKRIHNIFSSLGQSINNPWSNKNMKNGSITYEKSLDPDERFDTAKYFKINITKNSFKNYGAGGWGSRGGGPDTGFSRRSIW